MVGRPPKPKGEKQSYRTMIRFTEAEYRALEKLAGDYPVASYVRDLVLRHLKRKRGAE